jgi:hypothetical protein
MIERYIVAMLAAALALLAVPAMAQESTQVAVGGLYATIRPYLADLIGLAAVAVIGVLAKLIKDKFGIDIEARHREALHSAAVSGINVALSKLDDKAGSITIDVKNKLIADALNYAIKAAPDAIKHFGLDAQRDKLKAIIESKLQIALPDRPNA